MKTLRIGQCMLRSLLAVATRVVGPPAATAWKAIGKVSVVVYVIAATVATVAVLGSWMYWGILQLLELLTP